LKNLVHRAALIAGRDGATTLQLRHLELSIKHGRLLIGEAEITSNERHIRETFRRAIHNKCKDEVPEEFSWEELRELTRKHPLEVAYGFLRCCLTIRLSPERGYYKSSEIQTALARGMTLNAWLGKVLTREDIREAANTYFTVDASTWPESISIQDIVKTLRENSNERTKD
jgi:hypothetical protein